MLCNFFCRKVTQPVKPSTTVQRNFPSQVSQQCHIVCIKLVFKKWANPVLFFDYFRLFHMTHKFIKAQMVCLGLKPGAAGWKAQTNPLCYGGSKLFFFLKKWANPGLLFAYFRSFLVTISMQIEKAQMVCLGFKPGAAGWKAQMKPWSYGSHS